DGRLTTPKAWRDVYSHAGDRLTGWKRYFATLPIRVAEFTPEGWVVMKKDDRGRPIEARTVIYRQAAPAQPTWANTNLLEQQPGDEVITFAYEGEKRTIKSREKVKEKR